MRHTSYYRQISILTILIILSLQVVSSTDYYVTNGNDDFYTSQPDGGSITYSYTTTTIIAGRTNTVTPSRTQVAHIGYDTSSIPDDDVISAATVYFYGNTYTATKGVTKTYLVWMYDGSNYNVLGSGTFVSAGWISFALSGGQLAYVDKTGLSRIRISIEDPGAAKYRSFTIRASEYAGTTYDPYISVTHTAPASGYCNGEYDGTGDWIITTNTVCNDIETIPVQGQLIISKGTSLAIKKEINITIEK